VEQWILQFAGRAHASAGTNSLHEEGEFMYVDPENVLKQRERKRESRAEYHYESCQGSSMARFYRIYCLLPNMAVEGSSAESDVLKPSIAMVSKCSASQEDGTGWIYIGKIAGKISIVSAEPESNRE
jgi:hypothetical protein